MRPGAATLPPMPHLAILKTGSTRLAASVARRGGDYEHWFAEGLRPMGATVEVLDAVGGTLPDRGSWDGIVITGSPASVHDAAPWSERAAAWVARQVADGMPTLGVCYGHQLLAHALGGTTGPAAAHEVGLFDVELVADDPLFEGLPRTLPSFLIHYDEVTALPRDARVLARSARCPVEAFAVGAHVRAVQWHPEFDAQGVREAIAQDAQDLRARGDDPDALAAGLRELPFGARLLQNFVRGFVHPRR
jgi:GMP synthase (glutamine-hydrolysing)